MPKKIHVAVGVIINAQRQVLISLRPTDVHQGGLWEFPGGKVEANETVQQALARELFEELALEVLTIEPLVVIEHDYGDKRVVLDTWMVTEFAGEPKGMEGQPLKWVSATELSDCAFPEANIPIIEKVQQHMANNLYHSL